ncbi:CoB--CoM heterodisulfide reductase iron-sulfur subunit B family protein [Treponema sp.]|uniref:CoB--CoM heterodisulfide reductase iron-sulfur subunit B family protein n=1 Tax=Treponema sp. TaxID=166 RepID=UPI0025FFD9E7|nr:CoB--CoM heterodisulfide reductase iron-sulfur subunit B family protein [Treponema sp.]MCR5218078.1 CoB--CoM heterodisulfide reductase iron-sulfur subunit B family protein [Treponema sp.]
MENITYSYFPGCTLKNKALDLDMYARKSAEALGFTLQEIPDWQCCGGEYPLSKDEIATKLSSVRALAASRDAGQELVTLCSACYNVLKQVNNDMITDENVILKVNNYLKTDGIQYNGETKVLHFLEILRDVVGWDKVKAAVKNPLKGKKIGAYYGCLLLRPGKVLQLDDPENPQLLEDFIKAIGATPVIYAQRNECCGAYTMFEDPSIPEKRADAIITNAKDQGAELLVTSCPLCRYNLIKNSKGADLPVVYFTELLAEALGVKEAANA